MEQFNPDKAQQYLRDMGYTDDSDEMKAFTSYAKMVAPQPAPTTDLATGLVASLGAGAVAGLDRLGGGDNAHAVAQGMGISEHLARLNQQAAEQQRAFAENFAGPVLKSRLSQIETDKRRGLLKNIMQPGQPGAPAPTSAVSQPVQRQQMPPVAGQGPAPNVPGTVVTPPTGGTPAPQAAPPGAPPSSSPPQAVGQSAGQFEIDPLRKYQIDQTQLRPLPYTDQQIADASVIDDKAADNMRQMNDQVMKENDQRIKLSEAQRAAAQNDPALAAQIEGAKVTAKANAERETAKRTTAREAQGVEATLQRLYDMPDTIENFDDYVGAWDSANPMGLRDMWDPKGVPVRSGIAGDLQSLSVAMKKFVRQPGEGSWSDSDQLGLEKMVGNAMNAANGKDFRKIVEQIRERISSSFTEPSGTRLRDLTPTKQEAPDVQAQRSANPQVDVSQVTAMPVGTIVKGYKKTAAGWVKVSEAEQQNNTADAMIPRP